MAQDVWQCVRASWGQRGVNSTNLFRKYSRARKQHHLEFVGALQTVPPEWREVHLVIVLTCYLYIIQ